MTSADTRSGAGGGIIAPPRRSAWIVALDLYRGGGSFRGFLEFALIGAVVLAFLPGGEVPGLGSLMRMFKPAPVSAPAPSNNFSLADPEKTPRPSVAIVPNVRDLKIEPSYFGHVPAPLRATLVAALQAYHEHDPRGAAAALLDADPEDRNVLLMRGLVQLSIPGAASIAAGLGLLQRAIDKGEPRAMAIMGVLKVSGLPGIPRDNAAGRALLEDAVVAGDAIAARMMGEGFITGWMGVVDPARAEKYLRLASDRGDNHATYRLGEMYLTGQGLPRNEPEAERLIRKAAVAGFPEAQAMLGVLRFLPYSNGLTDDPSEALTWFERAAAQGEPHGLFYLGMFYLEYGERAGRLDPPRGVEFMRRCVEQTVHHQCTFAYGSALDFGLGVERDPVKAYAMYSLASARDNATKARDRRDAVAKTLTPQQRLEGQRIANMIMREAARSASQANASLPVSSQQIPPAEELVPTFTPVQVEVGPPASAGMQIEAGLHELQAYAAGRVRTADQAKDHFRRAAAQGDPLALYYLGLLQIDPAPDLKRMAGRLSWCAGVTLDMQCLFAYAIALERGLGVARDPARAYVMYGLAFKYQRVPIAQQRRDGVYNSLSAADIERANRFYAGFMVQVPADVLALAEPSPPPPPDEQIVRGLKEAVANGDTTAMVQLADRLRSGYGVAKDLAEAERLLLAAAEEGHAQAMAMVGVMRLTASGFAAAQFWFRRAAAEGEPLAMLYLGASAAAEKTPGQENLAGMFELFRRCAELALNGQCLYAYGTAAEYGLGTTRDPLMAFVMYATAAHSAHVVRAPSKREELRRDLTEDALRRAREIATALWRNSRPGMAQLNETASRQSTKRLH